MTPAPGPAPGLSILPVPLAGFDWRHMGRATAVFPSPDHELLLRAAFADEEELPGLLEEAERRLGSGDLDTTARMMLPLLHPRLAGLEATPLVLACRAAYRSNWLNNQRRMRRVVAQLQLFAEEGIPTLLLKGSALIPVYYRDPGLRFMSDTDVLVPEKLFRRAGAVLENAGYRPLEHPLAYFDTRFGHAIAYRGEDGDDLDLHCHVLSISCELGADDAFWEAAVPLTVHAGSCQAATLSLCPGDQLLHACVHGLVWVGSPHDRWVADALMILRHRGGDVEWDRLVEVAGARVAAGLAAMALGYLIDRFRAPVPPDPLHELEKLGRRPAERRVVSFITRERRGFPLRAFHHRWNMLSRAHGSEGGSWRELGRRFLLHWCRTGRVSQVPGRMAAKLKKAVAARFGFHVSRQ